MANYEDHETEVLESRTLGSAKKAKAEWLSCSPAAN